MAANVGELEGRREGIGRLRYEGIDGCCTSIKIGHDHSVGPWEEVIEVLGNSTIRPGIGVGSSTKGRGKVNASIIYSKAGHVGVGKGQGKGIGGLGHISCNRNSTSYRIHDGHGIWSSWKISKVLRSCAIRP